MTNQPPPADITDEMIERARERVGKFEPIKRQWHSEAARDSIRHWCEAVADVNPLWIDDEYARETQYGVILAPPSFILSCNIGPAHRGATGSRGGGGLPGNIRQVWAGDQWEWFRPIYLGDAIRGTTGISDVIVAEKDSGRTMEQVTTEDFFNQRDELIARHRTSSIAMARRPKPEGAAPAEKPKAPPLTKHRWTPDELQSLNEDIDKEVVRGAETRYWDDVEVGEEIPHVVKGPLTITEMITFLQGWGGPFLMASEILHRYLRLHPKANVPDFDTGAPDSPTRVHWDERFAQSTGFPTGYDIGGMRLSWLIHALTNWASDDGQMRKIQARFTGLNILGDASWCKGIVTAKRVDDGAHLVDFDVFTVNQRGQRTTEGTATVELPAR